MIKIVGGNYKKGMQIFDGIMPHSYGTNTGKFWETELINYEKWLTLMISQRKIK